jgi:hypothetical protein
MQSRGENGSLPFVSLNILQGDTMRAVEIMRSELTRLNLNERLAPEDRRMLTNVAKDAKKTGNNPRAAVSRALSKMLNRNTRNH